MAKTTGHVPGPNARRYRSKDHWIIVDPDSKRAWSYSRSAHGEDGPTVEAEHGSWPCTEAHLFEGNEDMRALANSGDKELDPELGVRNQRALDKAAEFASRSFPLLIVGLVDQSPWAFHNVVDMTPTTEVPGTTMPATNAFYVDVDGDVVIMDAEQYAEYLADQERHETYGGVPEVMITADYDYDVYGGDDKA